MAYRRSHNDLAYGDDYYDSRGGGRWDRERFERVRARSRGPGIRESLRVEEDDRIGPRGSRRELEIDEHIDRRPPRPRSAFFEERERFYEDDRQYTPRRSRPEFFEEDRYRYSTKDTPPYMDRYREPLSPPRVAERIVPRYEEERDHGGDDVKINVRLGSPHDKRDDRRDERREEFRYEDREIERYAPPRRVYDERPYYRPPPPPVEPDWRDYEDYRDARIIRERTIDRRAPEPPRSVHEERISREEVREEIKEEVKRPPGTKKGKTRMPKRLVHKRAILEMGYPYDEEDDFYIIKLALGKDHIDECIKISERYKEEDKISYRLNENKETKTIEAPPPPSEAAGGDTEVVETVTRRIIENPTEDELQRLREHERDAHDESHESVHESFHESVREGGGSDREEHGSAHESEHGSRHTHRAPTIAVERASEHGDAEEVVETRTRSKSVRASRSKSRRRGEHRSKSRRRSARYEEVDDEEESGAIAGPLGLIISPRPRGHHHDGGGRREHRDRDIKAEIRELEAEKRALRAEQREEDDVVRVEKDRRGRLNLVRSAN